MSSPMCSCIMISSVSKFVFNVSLFWGRGEVLCNHIINFKSVVEPGRSVMKCGKGKPLTFVE